MGTRVLQVIITGNATGAQKAFQSLAVASGTADTALGRTGARLTATGTRLASFGASMTKKVTLPIVALGALAVKAFAYFDDAMVQSQAIMGDLSSAMKNKMEVAARNVAKTTTFSATQAAEAFFFLASAGLDAKQSIAALPQVSKFAQAGQFDLATATDLATDAQSALGLRSKDAAKNLENMKRVTDVLTKANILANASVEQFAISMTTKAGASAKVLGKSVEETAAVLSAFADQGVKAQIAGTQLSIVWRDLQTKSIQNREAFDKFGVSVFDAQGEMRNTADIIGDLEGALKGMSDEQQKTTLLTMGFTDKSIAAIQALLGSSDAIRAYEKELRNAGGTTELVANKQLESFKAKLILAKNNIADVAITIGEKLAPALAAIAIKIASVVTSFTTLPGPIQTATLVFLGFLAAIGPISFVVGKVIAGVGALVTAFGAAQVAVRGMTMQVAASTMPALAGVSSAAAATAVAIGLYAAAAAAAVVAVYAWSKAIGAWVEANRLHQESFEASLNLVGAWEEQLKKGLITGREFANKMTQAANDQSLSEEERNKVWQKGIGALRDFNTSQKQSIEVGGRLRTVTKDVAEEIKTFAGMTGAKLKEWKASVSGSIGDVKTVFSSLGDKANLTADKVVKAFTDRLVDIRNFKDNVAILLKRGLSETVLKELVDNFDSGGAQIAAALAKGGKGAIEEVNKAAGGIKRTAAKIPDSIVDIANPTRDSGAKIGRSLGEGMKAGIEASTPGVVAAARNMSAAAEAAARIRLETQSPSKLFMRIGRFIAEGLAIGIASGTAKATGALTKVLIALGKVSDRIADDTRASIDKIRKKLEQALDTKKLSDAKKNLLKEQAKDAIAAINARAREQQQVINQLESWGQRLASKLQKLGEKVRNFKDSIKGAFSFSLTGGESTDADPVSNLKDRLHQQLDQARKFAGALKQLRGAGASKALLLEVAGAGQIEGLQLAQTILSGGMVDFANDALREIADLTENTSNNLARDIFGSEMDELKDELRDLTKAIKDSRGLIGAGGQTFHFHGDINNQADVERFLDELRQAVRQGV